MTWKESIPWPISKQPLPDQIQKQMTGWRMDLCSTPGRGGNVDFPTESHPRYSHDDVAHAQYEQTDCSLVIWDAAEWMLIFVRHDVLSSDAVKLMRLSRKVSSLLLVLTSKFSMFICHQPWFLYKMNSIRLWIACDASRYSDHLSTERLAWLIELWELCF